MEPLRFSRLNSLYLVTIFRHNHALNPPSNVMKNISLGILFAALTLLACNKDTGFPVETYPPWVDPPPPFVPIFEPGDTSKGAAYADKLTKKWSASVFCKATFTDTSTITLQFFTYTFEGATREHLIFARIPKQGGVGQYKIKNTNTPSPLNLPSTVYTTWAYDGDVLEDGYRITEDDLDNYLTITKLDLTKKRVEGTFHVTYQIQEPRLNVANPKTVTFSSGRFWATIRD